MNNTSVYYTISPGGDRRDAYCRAKARLASRFTGPFHARPAIKSYSDDPEVETFVLTGYPGATCPGRFDCCQVPTDTQTESFV